ILDEARNKNEQVLAALDKQPLDIMEVNQSLQDAKNSTDKAVDQTNTMLEQAYMIEQVFNMRIVIAVHTRFYIASWLKLRICSEMLNMNFHLNRLHMHWKKLSLGL